MPKTYVTFGKIHTHLINDNIFDKYCVAVIECENAIDGRKKAFEYFNDKFCFSYYEDEFKHYKMMPYFPRGLIEIKYSGEVTGGRRNMCENEEHKCCGSGKVGDDVIYGPDPYAEDVVGDDTPVWECEKCRYDSAQDI